MKKIVVASQNPVKKEAVINGFHRIFPGEAFKVECVSVSSGVSDQPMTDQATRMGAINRASQSRQARPEADFWVGVEGGCDRMDDQMVAFAWVVVCSHRRQGCARTALFQLPPAVQSLIESGMELGDADDQVFGRQNSKQKSGAVGLLTGDVVTRTSLYEQAVILALIPFRNPGLYHAELSV